jgi:hypothetical protein
MDLGAEERKFEDSEHSGAVQEPREVPMVTEKGEEPQKGRESGGLTAAVRCTAIFRGVLKESER